MLVAAAHRVVIVDLRGHGRTVPMQSTITKREIEGAENSIFTCFLKNLGQNISLRARPGKRFWCDYGNIHPTRVLLTDNARVVIDNHLPSDQNSSACLIERESAARSRNDQAAVLATGGGKRRYFGRRCVLDGRGTLVCAVGPNVLVADGKANNGACIIGS